ncbi:caspase-2 isoform X2 [Dendropsophus ebraccatus]|uniref:caspase-2 isoform X2 n=1 Tax=Dendropsophus ebraccatus TaxID=150705 RepID=UPI0038316829
MPCVSSYEKYLTYIHVRMLGGMQDHHKEALIRLRVRLIQEMVPDELIDHLVAKKVLTPYMQEKIQSKGVSFRQNGALLDLLPKRGPDAFSIFCTALRDTDQEHLAQQLEQQMRTAEPEETCFPMSVEERGGVHGWREPCERCIDNGDGPGSVSLTTVNFYLSHHQQAYKMTTRPRGICLIISNVLFTTPELDYRHGGDVDLNALKLLFFQLNFRVWERSNITAQEILSELDLFSKRPEHSQLDSCIVAILSHGVDGAVYGSDGKLVQLQDVFTKLDNAHCPQLQNKPKMIFIQACRGDETDRGVDQRDGRERTGSPGCEQSDAGREDIRVRLPTQSDMICAYACLRGTVSLRNTKHGSWFIQDLTSVFSKYAKDTHVADMLVKVNARIKKREGHAPGTEYDRCKEMSEYSSTLCRDLYLFPGFSQ